ncbi:hypothetical protein [Candidatus Leptofilum sp.]|uniref:hypothetical protein n=1 Tax=Candidatus Leptofilum sp. TaxID=3241576 RepID=UPI003B59F752
MLESFECPNCQASLDYDAASPTLTVRCPYCGSTVIVPDNLRNPRQQPQQSTEVLTEVVQLVGNGRKIEAIKLFRERFNVGLKEAKDVVDSIERHEDVLLGGTNFHTEAVTIDLTNSRAVQTGGRGCAIFIGAMVLLAVGVAAAFFFVVPREAATIVESITTITESSSETIIIEDEINNVFETVESALPDDVAIVSTDPDFVEVILRIGGEEGTGPGFFNDTRRLAIDGDGNIYVGDYSGGRIQVFDENGEFVTTWNAGQDLYMVGIAANRAGTVYVIKTSEIELYNGLTGESLGMLNLPGGRTLFRTAASGPDGSVYFIAKDRLVRLDNNGNITLDITDPFANIPDFATTQEDAAVDGAGNIYVVGSETIYKLNSNGQFVDQIGSQGDAEDQFFTSPRAIAVDGQGRIFVESFRGIKVFEADGRYLTTIDSPGASFDMAFNDDNELLVMDRNGNELRKYQLLQ